MRGAWILLVGIVGCSSAAAEEEVLDVGTEEDPLTEEQAASFEVTCPRNTAFLPEYRLCANNEVAVGPFSPPMVEACKAKQGARCERAYWPVRQAKELRGTGFCGLGTRFDPLRGVCVDEQFAYGPFTAKMIDSCRARGGGDPCFAMKVRRHLIPTYRERVSDEDAPTPSAARPTPSPQEDVNPEATPAVPVDDATCIAATGYTRNTEERATAQVRCPSPKQLSLCVALIDDEPIELATAEAFQRMREAARADHVFLRVTSGFRTMSEQRKLYSAYQQGRGNPADPPGCSQHQNGRALDLNRRTPVCPNGSCQSRYHRVEDWLAVHAARFGFVAPHAHEPWHWELVSPENR